MNSAPPDPAVFGDYELMEAAVPELNPYSNPDYRTANPNRKEIEVQFLATLLANAIQGGFLRGYRTQVLGITGAVAAVGLYLIGDLTLTATVGAVISGLAWSAIGAKINALAKAAGLKVEVGTGITAK